MDDKYFKCEAEREDGNLSRQPQPLASTSSLASSSYDFGYRGLKVWQKAMQLVELVYELIRQLPAEERFALADQIRRAVVSIPSNIAEGNGRASNKDYAHFLAIARGSLFETMTQLEVSERLGYFSVTDEIEDVATEIRRMLGAMLQKYGAYHCQPQP